MPIKLIGWEERGIIYLHWFHYVFQCSLILVTVLLEDYCKYNILFKPKPSLETVLIDGLNYELGIGEYKYFCSGFIYWLIVILVLSQFQQWFSIVLNFFTTCARILYSSFCAHVWFVSEDWSATLHTHSMEQSPSWEANRFWGSQEIPRILCTQNIHYLVYNSPPPVPILSHLSISCRAILCTCTRDFIKGMHSLAFRGLFQNEWSCTFIRRFAFLACAGSGLP
jgi:hypothetical protein